MDSLERKRLEELLALNKEVLHQNKLKKGQFGIACPPHIIIEIDRIERENAEIEAQLAPFSQALQPRAAAQASQDLPAYTLQQAFRVGIYSQFAQEPESVFDYRLDLQSYFANGSLPSPQVWERELIPQLKKLRDACNQHAGNTIRLSPQVHISLGIALGTFFRETTPSTLIIHQFNRTTGQWEWWSSRAKPAQERAFHQHEVVLATSQEAIDQHLLFDSLKNYFDLNALQDLCFKLSIPYDDLAGNTLSAKARELIVYMRQRSRLAELQQVIAQERSHIAEQLHIAASEKQQISLELASARSLAAVTGDAEKAIKRLQLPITRRIQVGISDVSDESHAQSIAKQLRTLIVELRDGGYRQPIHLFAALPIGLAIMLGCQLNACGPIQLYEYSKNGDHSYYPAWRYNS